MLTASGSTTPRWYRACLCTPSRKLILASAAATIGPIRSVPAREREVCRPTGWLLADGPSLRSSIRFHPRVVGQLTRAQLTRRRQSLLCAFGSPAGRVEVFLSVADLFQKGEHPLGLVTLTSGPQTCIRTLHLHSPSDRPTSEAASMRHAVYTRPYREVSYPLPRFYGQAHVASRGLPRHSGRDTEKALTATCSDTLTERRRAGRCTEA
jgi:hypothetical protein